MPAAVVGLALVGGGVVTAATLGYVALGVTVAGMVTKNKTLLKIGGQLGLAAGVGAIATSFMSGTATAASTAGNAAKVATGANSLGEPSSALTGPIEEVGGVSQGSINNPTPLSSIGDRNPQIGTYDNPVGSTPTGSAPVTTQPLDAGYKAPELVSPSNYGSTQGTNIGANQGVTQGANIGTSQGQNLAPTGPTTANDPAGSRSTQAKPDSNFFEFMNKDANKYAMVEGGKIIAGGLQGMAASSNANVQLEENRRENDIRRANMNSVGRGNYGLMGAR